MSHRGDKQFGCTQCDRTFSTLHHLKRHKLTHTEENMFVCNQCNKDYSTPYELKVHNRSHTGEKSVSLHALQQGVFFKESAGCQ